MAQLQQVACPNCQSEMSLGLIMPGPLGYDFRTFECPLCAHQVKTAVKLGDRNNFRFESSASLFRIDQPAKPHEALLNTTFLRLVRLSSGRPRSRPRRTIPAEPSLSLGQKARWKSMLSALELIINGYIKLNDGAALARMKAHRQRLVAGVGDGGPFDRSPLLDTLNGEIALIDAGLEKMRSRNPEAAN
jgi:hypothetical protein